MGGRSAKDERGICFQCAANISKKHSCCSEDGEVRAAKKLKERGNVRGHGEEEGGEQSGSKYKKERRHQKVSERE